MASGINSTFRQVGIATGIALLGTLFSNKVSDEVLARMAAVPGLSHQGPQIATAVQSGEIGNVIAQLPAQRPAGRGRDHPGRLHHRPEPHPAGRGDHRAGVGVVSLVAIRSKDFAQQQEPAAPADEPGPP